MIQKENNTKKQQNGQKVLFSGRKPCGNSDREAVLVHASGTPLLSPLPPHAIGETSPRPRPQTQNFTRSRSPGWHHNRLADPREELEPRDIVVVVVGRLLSWSTADTARSGSVSSLKGGELPEALAVDAVAAVVVSARTGKSTLCQGTPASSRQRWKATIVSEFRSFGGGAGDGRATGRGRSRNERAQEQIGEGGGVGQMGLESVCLLCRGKQFI